MIRLSCQGSKYTLVDEPRKGLRAEKVFQIKAITRLDLYAISKQIRTDNHDCTYGLSPAQSDYAI